MEFQGKNVVVTGAGKGIGLELCIQWLEAGAHVVGTLRGPVTPELLKLREIMPPAKLHILPMKVDDDHSVTEFGKALADHFQRLDILINNAGVIGDSLRGLEGVSAETVLSTFNTNALGPLRVTQAVLPLLLKAQSPKVVQISSLMGSIQDNESGAYYAYRMSKAALNMFNRSLSKDYPQITCLTLHPGWVQTDMGGQQAPVAPKQSVAGLLKVISNREVKSGDFRDFLGKELPW